MLKIIFTLFFIIQIQLAYANPEFQKYLDESDSLYLITLIKDKDFDGAKYLISKGVKLDTDATSALAIAIDVQNKDFIEYIWKLNPKFDHHYNFYNEEGSPLLSAIQTNNDDIFFRLINQGVDPKKENNEDVIISALRSNNIKIVKYLLDNGLKIDEKILTKYLDEFKDPKIKALAKKFIK